MNCRCPRPIAESPARIRGPALAGGITRRKMMLLCDSKTTHSTPPLGPGQLHLTDQVWVEIGGSKCKIDPVSRLVGSRLRDGHEKDQI